MKRLSSKLRQSVLILVPLLYCMLSVADVHAQVPGERPPAEIGKLAKPALDEGRRALEVQDAVAVRAAVAKAITVLGPWAGNPETATRYYPPIVTEPFDAAKAQEWWLREIEHGQRGLPWVKNPTGDPRMMLAGLREAAFPLDGLARTALLFPAKRDELTKQVRAGADWLIKLQHPSGVFPFPIGPGLNPQDKVGQIVARAIKDKPEIVVNDWIPDDFSDGGLQFDNGLCGRALITAWELTKDPNYLDAARKSGDWAITRPLVSNWNYNAFSVGLLARLAAATRGEEKEKYLASAVKKAEVGVLPGQMAGGRWFDAHNACAVYHNILLRELLELLHILPADHTFRPTLLDAVKRGLNQAADETLSHGFTGTWTDNFASGLHWIGENKTWRGALNVNLNASGKNGAPTPGFAILPVLEGILKQEPKQQVQAQPRFAWVTPEVKASRVSFHTFDSNAAKGKVSYHIYTPAAYDREPQRRFPVVYWLHGSGGGLAGLARIAAHFDAAIETGKTPPCFVVFVNGLVEGMYVDWKDGSAPMETIIVKELVPHIDATYRTIATREGRLLDGYSMGGYGAARLGFKYHDLFRAISIMGGGPLQAELIQAPRAGRQRAAEVLKQVYGGDQEYFRSVSPRRLAEQNVEAIIKGSLVRQVCGDEDETFGQNRIFHEHLERLKIPHTWTVLLGVEHNPMKTLQAMGDSNWAFYREAFGDLK